MTYRATPNDGIAWITGASSGIGRAVALELAGRGWRVAATARREAELADLSREAADKGWTIQAFPLDVTNRAAAEALTQRIETQFGPIALAMLNAGGFFPDQRDEWIGEGFRRTLELNLDGTVNCLAPLLAAMRARGRGQVSVMASVAGYGGLPTAPAYCASKSALIVMCESMKTPLARAGITVQVICPGFVKTPITARETYPMPFLMEADEAARRIRDGFERGGFEIAFPRRMTFLLKAINHLPYAAYFPVLRRGVSSRRGLP